MLGINCVIDVGGNEGQFGLMLRELGYGGHIISFEPVESVYARLLERARVDPKWKVHNVALGNEDVVRTINVTKGAELHSFLTPSDYLNEHFEGSFADVVRREEVQLRRLDSIYDDVMQDIQAPKIFLKLDTQGYDLEVLKGAKDTIRHIVGLQSEVSVLPIYKNMPDYLEALGIYRSLGFALTGLFTVSREPRTLKVIDYDCVMVRLSESNGLSAER
jgi:FkbM family methyltransferase